MVDFYERLSGGVVSQVLNETIQSNMPGRENGPADAYRHLLLSAELTRRFGEPFARAALIFHEMSGDLSGQAADEESMDWHNNDLGIQIGHNATSWADVVTKVRAITTWSEGNEAGSAITPQWLSTSQWRKNPTDQTGARLSNSDPRLNWPNASFPAGPYPTLATFSGSSDYVNDSNVFDGLMIAIKGALEPSAGFSIQSAQSQGASLVITRSDGNTFTINPASASITALSTAPIGQSYFFDTGVAAPAFVMTSAALVGKEISTVYNALNGSSIAFDQASSAGAGTLKLPDGTILQVAGAGSARLASMSASEQDLISYLSTIGGPATVAQLEQLHIAQVKPAAASLYEYGLVTSTRSDGSVNVNYYVTGLTNSQVTGGAVTGTVAPNLVISGNPTQHATLDVDRTVDFTQASISGFETLTTHTNGKVILTPAQLNSIQSITGISVTAISGGTYSLAGKSTIGVSLTATSWDGTTLIGGNGAVELTASLFGNDTLQAGTGNSTLKAGYGVNTIIGGNGNDSINLLTGKLATGSSINGGAGADILFGNGLATDTLDISQGTIAGVETLASLSLGSVQLNADELAGFSSIQTSNNSGLMLVGSNAGTYSLAGKSLLGAINLTGSSGDDVLVGGTTTQKIYGGLGNDRINYNSVATLIDGGVGNDTIVFTGSAPTSINLANSIIGSTAISGVESVDTSAATGALTITGDANANTIKGGIGADTLLGGDGNDTIYYDAADILENGGAGSDTLVLSQSVATIVDLTLTADQVAGGGTAINFENLDGTGSTAALTLTGDGNANTIKGGYAADAISGGAGDDTISYDALDVSADGGTGSDTLVLSGTTAITSNLSTTSDQVTGGGTTTGFENIDGNAATAALTLAGDANSNVINGGSGNDTIVGGGGADSISGGGGDDTIAYDASTAKIDGGTGDDTLIVAPGTVFDLNSTTNQVTGSAIVSGFEHIVVASGGVSILNGDSSANTLQGTSGVDRIDGLGGADSLYGNGGDDAIVYDAADVIADGGAGIDTLIVSQTASVIINLSNIADQMPDDAGITTGFENADGTDSSADLTITGDAGTNVIKGGAGNDVLYGTAGGDQRYGNAGDDIVVYVAADSITDGSSGSDTLYFKQLEATTVDLANSADQVIGGGITTGFENVDAYELSTGINITGDVGDNTIYGGTGNDVINGNGGYDYISAGAGDDTVTYNDGAVMYGDAGNDTLVLNLISATTVDLTSTFLSQVIGGSPAFGFENVDGSGSSAGLKITGDAGANILKGGAGYDVIYASGGGDQRYGNGGNDIIVYDNTDTITDGGSGNDTIYFKQPFATTINLSSTSDQVVGGGATTGFENVSSFELSVGLNITGDANANQIAAGSGNDVIDGMAGPDFIDAGAGDDTVAYDSADIYTDGGEGNDTLILRQTIATSANLANPSALISGQVTGAAGEVTNFENIDGSASTASLDLTGDAGANALKGGGAADIIHGGDSSDTINGNGGADNLFGEVGNDIITYDATDTTVDGGAGLDTLVLAGAVAYTANLANTADQVSSGGTTTAFENVDGSTSTAALSIAGDSGTNILRGGTGNDVIYGSNGADQRYGGDGNDTIYYAAADTITDGGVGTDKIVFYQVTTATIVDLSNSDDQVLGGGVTTGFESVDATTSSGAFTITGDATANFIYGGSGNDTIHGGDGGDTIYANGGADQIYGDAGDDYITYDAADTTIDGGAGNNNIYLIQTVATTVNMANVADQIVGGGTITNFTNVFANGSTAALSITGDANANYLKGGTSADFLDGGAGADSVYGWDGNDAVVYDSADWGDDGGNGIDTLILNQTVATTVNLANTADQVVGGHVTVNFENVDGSGSTTALSITGDAGENTIVGGAGADSLFGSGGNDTITYDAADVTTDAGVGVDTLMLKGATATTVNLAATTDQVTAGGTTIGFENVDGSTSTVALSIAGDSGTNILRGGSGNDVIYGSNGADQRYGGDGNDIIYYNAADAITDGGAGTADKIVFYQVATAITVDLSNVADQVVGGGNATGFESVDATTSSGAFIITGDAISNFIYGGSGNDIVHGGDGNDTIYGNGGADGIFGDGGDDHITYDAGDTTVDGGTGSNNIYLNQVIATTVNLANAADQIVGGGTTTNFTNVIGIGSTASLTITGDASGNYLRGGTGADILDGGAGADSVYAGDGSDTVVYDSADWLDDGGNGNDTLALNQTVATTVNLANTTDQVVGGGTTVNFENVDGSGGTAALNITGDAGDNIIKGGSAADIVKGGLGNDQLYGGLANDAYNFSRGDGADIVFENDATVANKDILLFAPGVNYDQLWFKQVGNSLEVDVIGTSDSVTIDNWYLGSARQAEAIQAGGLELINSNVINLVNAMAGMAQPGAGQTTLTMAQHTALDPVIAANWHAAA